MKDFKLFGRDVLNIFCDASIKHTTYSTYGCPGSIAIDTTGSSVDYDSTILVDTTNNESEIYAIILATQQAIKYKEQYKRINIFSDSRISVCGVREWMINWVKKAKNDTLMSTSGIVANQQLFLHTIYLILNYLDSYRLYHIDGHMKENDPISIKIAMDDFRKFNGISIGPIEMSYLCKYNNLVDRETRYELEITNLSAMKRLNPGFIYPIPTASDMNKIYGSIFDN